MLNECVGNLGEAQVWVSDPGPCHAGIAWILLVRNYRCVHVCTCVRVCVCLFVCVLMKGTYLATEYLFAC